MEDGRGPALWRIKNLFCAVSPKGERQQEVLQMNQAKTAQSVRTAQSASVRSMVLLSLFTAIIFLMAYTPIGYIDLPLIKATIIHVPVIIGAVLLGPRQGAFLA